MAEGAGSSSGGGRGRGQGSTVGYGADPDEDPDNPGTRPPGPWRPGADEDPQMASGQTAGYGVYTCPLQQGRGPLRDEPCNLDRIELKLVMEGGGGTEPVTVVNTAAMAATKLPAGATAEEASLLREYAVVIDQIVRFVGDEVDEGEASTRLNEGSSKDSRTGQVSARAPARQHCAEHPYHHVFSTDDDKSGKGPNMGPVSLKIERAHLDWRWLKHTLVTPSKYSKIVSPVSEEVVVEGVSCGLPDPDKDRRSDLKGYVRLRSADEWSVFFRAKKGLNISAGGSKAGVRNRVGKAFKISSSQRSSSVQAGRTTWKHNDSTESGTDSDGRGYDSHDKGWSITHGDETLAKKENKDTTNRGEESDAAGMRDARDKAHESTDEKDPWSIDLKPDAKKALGKEKVDKLTGDDTLALGLKWNGVEVDTGRIGELITTIQDTIDTTFEVLDSVYRLTDKALSVGIPITYKLSWKVDCSLMIIEASARFWNQPAQPLKASSYYIARTTHHWEVGIDVTWFKGSLTLAAQGQAKLVHEKIASVSLTLSLTLTGEASTRIPVIHDGGQPKVFSSEDKVGATLSVKGEGNIASASVSATGSLTGGLTYSNAYDFNGSDIHVVKNLLTSDEITYVIKVYSGIMPEALETEDAEPTYVWPKNPDNRILLAKDKLHKDFTK